ncbi:hypothetical protein, variant [Aphanomyces invadans]|uniref:FYVE-type domain-containing protein n=1 Tax=Aphanomyces invadans TaxID=157072 RepID=A0A024U387_9STRA|nr:hypothetical protein, variant [Aphanomyces invadans]ETW00695.1 hypothetical protein, variant [Aphanomyces invadans]|eukprot:XP_008870830.1 hypothetical protein, variant [Aphanomyces invadans]
MPIVGGGTEAMKCREYIDVAVSMVQDAIDHRKDWMEDARHDHGGWKLTVNKRNMQVFRHRSTPTLGNANMIRNSHQTASSQGGDSSSHASASSLYTFLTVGYLNTTIDELHTALFATTSVDDQIMHSLLLEKEYVTSHVLQTLSDMAPLSLDPHLPAYCGVKYIKIRMPASQFGLHPREAVYLEYLTLREDNTLARVVYSIDNYLPLVKDHHRAVLRDVWLFMPAPNGKIQVVAKTFHDMQGSAPKILGDQSALSFWRVYEKLTSLSYIRRLLSAAGTMGNGRGSVSDLARSLPITRESYHRPTNFGHSNLRTYCQCCRRKFTLFHGKRFCCSQCSMTMCSNCHLRVVYSIQASPDPVPFDLLHLTAMTPRNDVVCLACVHRSKETFSDFVKVKTPEVDDDAWEAALGIHATGHAEADQHHHHHAPLHAPLDKDAVKLPPHAHHAHHGHAAHPRPGSLPAPVTTLPVKESDCDVFQEMRKSIAIQESILSAMRASWHGHTEQEMCVQQPHHHHQRPSEFTFERDSDRFEEVVE